ncbi:hypothetical protein ACOME3_009473 [Neoechinorhynchus agilis]
MLETYSAIRKPTVGTSGNNNCEMDKLIESGNISAIDYYNYFSCGQQLEFKPIIANRPSSYDSQKHPIGLFSSLPKSKQCRNNKQIVCMASAGSRIKPSEMRYCSDKKREAIVNKILQEEKIKQIRRSLAEYEQFREYIEGLNSSDEQFIEENVRICIEASDILLGNVDSYSSKDDDDPYPESSFFGTLCLSFNAKLGLIQQEVSALGGNLNQAESEVIALQKRVHALEVELEQSERRLYETTDRLEEVNMAVSESERGRQVLDQKNDKYEVEINEIEQHYEAMRAFAMECDKRIEEIFEKWNDAEKQLEMIDLQASQAESKEAAVEMDLNLFRREYLSTKNKFDEYSKKEGEWNEEIKKLNQKLVEAECRYDASGAATTKLLKLIEKMEALERKF